MARLLAATGGVALVTVLFTGCGSGGVDGAKVETSLRQYISTLTPGGPFPVGAGPPRVKHDGCKDGHVTTKKGHVYHFGDTIVQFPAGLKLWSCIVTFRSSLTVPVGVVLKGSKVVAVTPKASPDTRPTTVYEGGPKQPKP
jgi:hypothetical protein